MRHISRGGGGDGPDAKPVSVGGASGQADIVGTWPPPQWSGAAASTAMQLTPHMLAATFLVEPGSTGAAAWSQSAIVDAAGAAALATDSQSGQTRMNSKTAKIATSMVRSVRARDLRKPVIVTTT